MDPSRVEKCGRIPGHEVDSRREPRNTVRTAVQRPIEHVILLIVADFIVTNFQECRVHCVQRPSPSVLVGTCACQKCL